MNRTRFVSELALSFESTIAAGATGLRACRTAVLAVGLTVASLATVAPATVFHSRDEALRLAFPEAERTEAKDFFLTPEQRAQIEEMAQSRLESDLLTVYIGRRGDTVLGYAILDTHVVRTLPETFLAVLSPTGAIVSLRVLAFYEPLDYLPTERWLAQFHGKSVPGELRLGRDIAGITGATLSARAVGDGIRRALAIHHVLLGGK